MAVFDLHSDILTDIAIRREAGERNVFDRIHYPNLKHNNVQAIICVVWVEPKYKHNRWERFKEIVAYAMDDIAESKHIHLCKSSNDRKSSSNIINVFLGIEGMSFISEAVNPLTEQNTKTYFDTLHDIGFRTGILAWNEVNDFASGANNGNTKAKVGLTKAGQAIVSEMMNRNWLIDVSHLDEQTFWDIYELDAYPIFASHSNAFTLCPNERNLTDKQLKAIAERNGIIGMNAYAEFIAKDDANLDRYIEHIEYVTHLVGMEHVALGFDFMDYLSEHDMGTNFTEVTKDFNSVNDIPRLLERLKMKGWTDKEISLITYENASRFIKNMDKG